LYNQSSLTLTIAACLCEGTAACGQADALYTTQAHFSPAPIGACVPKEPTGPVLPHMEEKAPSV